MNIWGAGDQPYYSSPCCRGKKKVSRRTTYFYGNDDPLQGFSFSGLVNALMTESENDLRSQLQGSNQHSRTPDIGINRLLSVSIMWPTGLRILLQAYAQKLQEREIIYLLEDAILSGIVESVQGILDFDAPICADHLRRCASPDMLAVVRGCYISRRESLLRLGVTSLPRHVQLRLGLRYDLLPDQNAL
jgi:hypothetical protein